MDTRLEPDDFDFSFGDFSNEEISFLSRCHGKGTCGVKFVHSDLQSLCTCGAQSQCSARKYLTNHVANSVKDLSDTKSATFIGKTELSFCNGEESNSTISLENKGSATAVSEQLVNNESVSPSLVPGPKSTCVVSDSEPTDGGVSVTKEASEDCKEAKAPSEETTPQMACSKERPSLWSSLFVPGNTGVPARKGVQRVSETFKPQEKESSSELHFTHKHLESSVQLTPIERDPRLSRLLSFVDNFKFGGKKETYIMRGLINKGNWCYINATLQVLLGVAPFFQLFRALDVFASSENGSNKSAVPLIDSMILFMNKFAEIENLPNSGKKQAKSKSVSPFEPKEVYNALPLLKSTLSEKGRQEDAEEFLSFLLNGLHDEFSSLENLSVTRSRPNCLKESIANGASESPVNEEDWEHVGPKNRSAVLRKTECKTSFVRLIFGGIIRSSVHRSGSKESASLQPFFTLQLDIQSDEVHNVREAIELYFAKKSLQGFTCSKTNAEVEAFHKTSLEELPQILILHLKYFVFDKTGGSQKLHKAIDIYPELEMPRDVLSVSVKSKISLQERQYQLLGVVYHHGKNAAGGHYTAAVKRVENGGWSLCDDNVIKPIHLQTVIDHQEDRVPYLLLYQRVKNV